MTFLREIARELLATHGQQLHTVGLVFPSRRAGVHFRAALQEELKQPAFAPRIYTLNDWIYRQSQLEPVDPVRLLFRLYRHYRELLPQRDEGFTSFSSWGQGLLRDFAEVDNYLLDADDVFRFLNQEKAIELWQPDRGALSEYEQNFLNFTASWAASTACGKSSKPKERYIQPWPRACWPKAYTNTPAQCTRTMVVLRL